MEHLLEKEREARIANDTEGLKRVFGELVQLCSSDQELLSLVKILSVKRGQSGPALRWLIGDLFEAKKAEEGFVGFFGGLLEEVIEGKIFLEEERVYISEEMRRRYEETGDVESAFRIVIGVPVETFTMIPEERIILYQLEQLRLCMITNNWIRAEITEKKIRRRYFEETGKLSTKIEFYELLVQLNRGQRRFLEVAELYLSLSEMATNRADYVALSSFFCIIATCESEHSNVTASRTGMLTKLSEDKNNDEQMRMLVRQFLGSLIIQRTMAQSIGDAVSRFMSAGDYAREIEGAIDEHNFKIVERFYSSIKISEMSMVLQRTPEDVVAKISSMVNSRFSGCRISQDSGTVYFAAREWSDNIGPVLDKLIKCNYLIHKERLKSEARN
jgi:26S proteasome regulatory subunit N5